MANNIPFEDEIKNQNDNNRNLQYNSDENTLVQRESSTVEGNSGITDENLGNIEQDGITSSYLNDIKPSENGISYEILEIDDTITTYNEINEETNPVNETEDNITNKEIHIDEGKNEQDSSISEINTDKSNEMGNTDQQSLEKIHEVTVLHETLESKGRERGCLGEDDVMVKMRQSPIDDEGNSHHAGLKRRLKKELVLLGANINTDEFEGKFDVYGDNSQIYRKYKLRKTEQKISYKEPSDWKPKRCVTPDNGPTSLECGECYQEFESKRALQGHLRSHGTVLEFTCSLCSQKFNKNSDLIAHKSTHNNESFLCKQCKVAFSDHCDYLQHKLTHSTQSHFTCPECGLQYNRTSYKIHIWTHYNKKFNCHLCPYVGNGENNLQSHINQRHIHSKTCVECGRVFSNTNNLEYHMISHTGVKKYQCLYCGKCFATNCARKLHTRLHTGEKPYSCDICGHRTAQSNDLKLHKITHETEKKYSCDLCPKKYFYKSYLVIHMRSHTQEHLYECPECDGKFVNPGGLKTHYMFKHLSERPVECTVCNKHFINKNQYQKHTRSKSHKRNMYGHMLNNGKSNE